jgi:hypothetical protein
MSALLEMLIPAAGLSLLALGCLALLPRAPAELRFSIAAAGLAAWAVPWPLLRFTAPLMPAAVAWLPAALGRAGTTLGDSGELSGFAGSAGRGGSIDALPWLAAVLFAVGAAWFVMDCARARAAIRAWRGRSVNADSLRALLPAPMRVTRAAIRSVRGSPHAAASGYFRSTIWIGDELQGRETIRVALLHECWHVRRHDPLKLLLVTALRRAYWWNPLVAALARHAALMLEAACDRRCARDIGKDVYVAELARTMLAAGRPVPLPLAAAAGTRGSNLLRLDLLNRETLMRTRDNVLLGAFGAGALAIGACQSLEPASPLTTVEIRDPAVGTQNVQISASRFVMDQDSGTLSGSDLRLETTAENLVMVNADRILAQRDAITLTGHVLLALGGSDLEADEVTIRARDGGLLDLRPNDSGALKGREIEIRADRARVTSAYDPRVPVTRAGEPPLRP